MATCLVGAALALVLWRLARAFARDLTQGCCVSGCSGCAGGCRHADACAGNCAACGGCAHRP